MSLQTQVPRHGGRLGGDPLHHAAVPAQDINFLVEQAVIAAEASLQLLLANRHADG